MLAISSRGRYEENALVAFQLKSGSPTWSADFLSVRVAVELVVWTTVDVALRAVVITRTEHPQFCYQTIQYTAHSQSCND